MANFSSFKVPKILYIHAVFVEDCKEIADVLEERLLEDNKDTQKPVKSYTLPHIYYGKDTWLQNCDVKCFYCDRFFDTMPLFVPKSIEKSIDGKFYMPREGCFDTWPCVAKYISLQYPNYTDFQEKMSMLLFLYENMTGEKLISIPYNISKYDMIYYTGQLTSAKWSKKNAELMKEARAAAGYN